MWAKIKQFWNWVLVKIGYRKVLIIERVWPYEDNIITDEGKVKIIYAYTEKHLESKLSRKFRKYNIK